MDIVISTDKEKLDIDFIHQFLTVSYWAIGRSKEEVEETIKHCLNFGVYIDDKQIGYARILTDYTIFGYLMDVFIIEEHRGLGYAKQLISTIMSHKKLKGIQKWMLATSDAHGLYKQFGFDTIPDPTKIMTKSIKS